MWDVITEDGFLDKVNTTADRLRSAIEQFIGNYPNLFTGVRGKGLFIGITMTEETRDFVAHLRDQHNLLLVAAGDQTLRVLPPLNIEQAHIDEFIEKLSAGAASYEKTKG